MKAGYVRSMVDEYGRRMLVDAAVGNFHDDIPEHMRDECREVGQYLLAMANDQREYEAALDRAKEGEAP